MALDLRLELLPFLLDALGLGEGAGAPGFLPRTEKNDRMSCGSLFRSLLSTWIFEDKMVSPLTWLKINDLPE
jgi:hypothetical protein